jgi:hypothetical protein
LRRIKPEWQEKIKEKEKGGVKKKTGNKNKKTRGRDADNKGKRIIFLSSECSAMQLGGHAMPFRSNHLPPSSIFCSEDGGKVFLRNDGIHLPNYTLSYTERPQH